MNKSEPPTPAQRMRRMLESFDKDRSVLREDYAYFTTPDAPTRPSKALRTSEAPSARRGPRRS